MMSSSTAPCVTRCRPIRPAAASLGPLRFPPNWKASWQAARSPRGCTACSRDIRESSAAFSGDGKRVVTASADNTARIWDAESGKEIAVLKGHTDRVRSAAFSRDGKRVVTASEDNTARIWDAESGKEIAVLKGHTDSVWSAAFSGDGKRVVTASLDKTARIWDAESGKEITVLKGHTDSVCERGVQRRRQAGGDGVCTTTPRASGMRRAARRSPS